eukprot:6463916-Pyramimonas_sp.AAC.1
MFRTGGIDRVSVQHRDHAEPLDHGLDDSTLGLDPVAVPSQGGWPHPLSALEGSLLRRSCLR